MADLSIGYDSTKAASQMGVWLQAAKRGKTGAADLEKAVAAGTKATERQGKAHKDAATKLSEEKRIRELAVKVQKDWNVTAQTASRIARLFKGDSEKLTAAVRQEAVALDRAQRETKQLTAAQRTAAGGMSFSSKMAASLTRNLLATVAAYASLRAIARETGRDVRASLDFQQEISRLETLAGVAPELVAEWKKELLEIGPATRTAVEELPPALFAIASGGTRGAEALEDLSDSAKASSLGLGTSESIARLATAAYQAYGRAAFDAVKPTDIIGKSAEQGSFKVDALADKLGEAIPIARTMKVSFGELAGTVAAFTKLGVNAEVAVTGVRATLSSLQAPGEQAKKVFKEIGTSADELRRRITEEGLAPVLVDLLRRLEATGHGAEEVIPNVRALTAVLATAGIQGEAYVKIARDVADAQGFINDRFEDTAENAPEAVEELDAALSSLRVSVGLLITESEGYLQFVQDLTALVNVLRSGGTETDKMRVEALGLRAALEQLGPAVGVAGLAIATQAANIQGMLDLLAKISPEAGQLAHMFRNWGRETEAVDEATKLVAKTYEKFSGTVSDADDVVSNFWRKQDAAAQEQEKVMKKLRSEGERFTQQYATAGEQLATAMEDAERLFRAGVISTETYARALEELAPPEVKQRLEELAQAMRDVNAAELELVMARNQGDFLPSAGAINVNADGEVEVSFADIDQLDRMQQKQIREEEKLLRQRERMEREFLADLGGLFGQLSAAFHTLGAEGLGQLAGVGSQIAEGVGQFKAAQGALGQIGAAVGIFTTVYGALDALVKSRRAKKFSAEAAASFTGGRFLGRSLVGQHAAVSREEGILAARGIRQAMEDITTALGGVLSDFPEIAIKIRNDGEQFEAAVAGRVLGTFSSYEAALQAGLEEALGAASFENVGPTLQTALKRVGGGVLNASLEELQSLVPILRQIDDASAGVAAGTSEYLTQLRQWQAQMDVQGRQLLTLGATLEQVVAVRERELALERESIELSGASLAGVSSQAGALRDFLNQSAAYNIALGEEAARREALTAQAEALNDVQRAIELTGIGAGRELTGMAETAEEMGDVFEGLNRIGGAVALDTEVITRGIGDYGEAIRDAEEAQRLITEAYRETVREAVRLQAQGSFLGDLLAFQQEYGLELVSNRELQTTIAEIEFRSAQMRLQLQVRELTLNRELLGLTEAQIERYRQLGEELGALDFPGLRGGGGGGRRQQREAEAQRAADAAEAFRRRADEVAATLAGPASAAMFQWSEVVRSVRENADKANIPLTEADALLRGMAALDLRPLAESARETVRMLRSTDLRNAMAAFRADFREGMREAMARAGDNPEAAKALRQALRAQLVEQFRELGRETLGGLGSGLFDLRQSGRQTVREIRSLVTNADALGLSLERIGNIVRDAVVPQILDLAIREAERTGNLKEAAALQAQQADIQRAFDQVQLRIWRNMLLAADALDAKTAALIDRTLELLDLPTAPGGPPPGGGGGITVPGVGGVRRVGIDDRAAAPPGGPSGPAAESLADIIDQLTREAMSPQERLFRAWQDLQDRIHAGTGTAIEQAEALRLAEERYNRERLAGLRDLFDQLTEEDLTADLSPRRAFDAAMQRFNAAAASGDVEEVQRAAEALLGAAGGFGEGFSRRAAENQARDLILSTLATLGVGLESPPPGPSLPPSSPPTLPPLPAPPSAPSPTPQSFDLAGITVALQSLDERLLIIEKNTRNTAANSGAVAVGFRALQPILERI